MRSAIPNPSQLFLIKVRKSNEVLRIRPVQGVTVSFRPKRAGPPIVSYECKTD